MIIIIDRLTLVVALLLETCLVLTLFRRRHYLQYPFFFNYVICAVSSSIARLMALDRPLAYFYVYWSSEILFKLLAMASLYEVFRKMFQTFTVYKWFRFLFPTVVAFVLLIAIWHGIKYASPHHPRITILILNMEVGINMIQAAILGLFFGLAAFFRITWPRHSRAVVEGFAAIGLAGLLFLFLSENALRFNVFLSYVAPISYIVALVIWIDAFRRPLDPELAWPITVNREQMLAEVVRYLSFLKRMRSARIVRRVSFLKKIRGIRK